MAARGTDRKAKKVVARCFCSIAALSLPPAPCHCNFCSFIYFYFFLAFYLVERGVRNRLTTRRGVVMRRRS